MTPIALCTRSVAVTGSGARDTASPAAEIAPKRIRANVCSRSSSTSRGTGPSTARTMSRTFANVDRSSCSR
jgi:hypothetical protein